MSAYSILIPLHNEVKFIPDLLKYLKKYKNQGDEIFLIDDGSNDGSAELLQKNNFIKFMSLKGNHGKGVAIRQGLKNIKNNKVIIFDADLEINPLDISKLMILDRNNGIHAVMGSRFKTLNPVKSSLDWGNFMFTSFFNILFKTDYKDVLCCAKSFYYD